MVIELVKKSINKLARLLGSPFQSSRCKTDETAMLAIGALLSNQQCLMPPLSKINDSEFKIFSQFGDDGIIQYLIHQLDVSHRTFVEFGVENYAEANTRFLLMNDNWRGLIMDGSAAHIRQITNDPIYWKFDLTTVHAFVDVENINQLILLEEKIKTELEESKKKAGKTAF